MLIKKIIWLSIFGIIIPSFGQNNHKNDSVQKKLKLIPLPALFYSPETRLGYGALVTTIFNLDSSVRIRNSNVQTLIAHTLNNQIIVRIRHMMFTKMEKYMLSGELNYNKFPLYYYGIGNDTKEEYKENLIYKVFDFNQRVMKNIKNDFFVGFQYRYSSVYDLLYEPKFLVDDLEKLQSQVGKTSALGFSFLFDSRDNVLNASSGGYYLLSSFFHRKFLGSDFDFDRYTLDIRKYVRVNRKGVLATQIFGEFNTPNTPFREMSLLGGDMIMRGYYNGRFRDLQQISLQTEYRYQIHPVFGLVSFASFGDVSNKLKNFNINEFKWAAGLGLRIMVNKSDKANIRIDYGIGKSTTGFYFSFSEAF